jgi:hypothetical protein
MTVTTRDDWTMGFEGKLYVGEPGSIYISEMILCKNIKDVKITPAEFEEIDATLRRHGGNKAYLKGVKDIKISFTLANMITQTTTSEEGVITDESEDHPEDVKKILEALYSRKKAVTFLAIPKVNGKGLRGDFLVFGKEKTEGEDEAQVWECEAKPAAFGSNIIQVTSEDYIQE